MIYRLAAAALVATASASAPDRVLYETDIRPCDETSTRCAQWGKKEKATSAQKVELTVVLKKSKDALQTLEDRFWSVSTPGSDDYGKHLTSSQIRDIVSPPSSVVDKVSRHFQGKDTTVAVGAQNDLIKITMPSDRAEEIFGAPIHVFEHTAFDVEPILRATEPYSLPSDIAQHVVLVSGLRHFPTVRKTLTDDNDEARHSKVSATSPSATWPTDCGKCSKGLFGGGQVTPEVLTQRYNLGQRTNGTAKGSIAVAEFTQVYYDQDDLTLFGQYCGIGNVTVDHYVGPTNEPKQCQVSIIIRPNLCKEALLDLETIKGISGTIPLSNYYSTNYDLLGWAKQINDLSDADMPLVHSVSYGNDEAQQTSAAFMESVNVELQKLGARGATVLFASGDGGVIGRRGDAKKFDPGFPAASPYCTTVGGTDFVKSGVIGDETTWWGSGGGFSNTFSIPDYQTDAVAAYKKTAAASLPPANKWNQTGCGFPDVSALGGRGNQYCITLDKHSSGAYGTSAATPVVATIMAKLNELRLAAGKSPLGFVNPLLYKHPEAFHDVTTGNNGGRNGAKYGFNAVAGWDPATGLGTPNFEELAKVVMNY